MELARVLALRGFEVELYEKSDKLGGQINEISDPFKYREFIRLVEYYEKELKRLGIKMRLGVEYRGDDAIYAIPKERQPNFVSYKGLKILVDSNLYAYQDYVFKWAENNEVYVTENVFKGLDRNRAYLLQQVYKELGVRVVKEEVKADVVIRDIRKDQPSIGKSIARGYWMGITYPWTVV